MTTSRWDKSRQLFEEAQQYIPGGVNSPVRAFRSVDMEPPFIARGDGAYLYDADGNRYIDYVLSWGPLILGHCHPAVVAALGRCLENGTSFGAPTELEILLARKIVHALPSVEMVRMVNSGTEATMSAIRLARAFTGRDLVIKFEGCYHGHADYLLIKAGSGALTLGIPTSPGVPASIAQNTLTVPFNNVKAVEEAFEKWGRDIAAIIVEPVAGNMGCIPPLPGFLEGLRDITKNYGALLIFDEVMTGFRVGYHGAQGLYGITPDLTCLGKVIGGGLPVGAYGGRREIMERIAPLGPVYQAGTLSGNPLAMTAGLATLEVLEGEGVYQELEEKSEFLCRGLKEVAEETAVKATFTRVGAMFSMFFTPDPVTDYDSAVKSDTKRFAEFFRSMISQGIYLAPSQFEAGFMSLVHSREDLETTIEAARRAFKGL